MNVHPDDASLVIEADLEWLSSLTDAEIALLKKTDDGARMDAVEELTRQGMEGMQASRYCWKSFPVFYVDPAKRGTNAWRFIGDNAELPLAVKDRVNRLAIAGALTPEFASKYETTNAAIRALLKNPLQVDFPPPDRTQLYRKAVQEHTKRIFKLSMAAGEATRTFLKDQMCEELTHQQWFAVVMEFHNLYLILTDRTVLDRIHLDSRRLEAMEDLSGMAIDTAVAVICNGWGEDRIAAIQRESLANYGRAVEDYGSCSRLFAEQGENAGGTVFWEFATTVSGFFEGYESDISYIMLFTSLIDMKGLQTKEFIYGVNGLDLG